MLGVDVVHFQMEVLENICYSGLKESQLVRSRNTAKVPQTAENKGQGGPCSASYGCYMSIGCEAGGPRLSPQKPPSVDYLYRWDRQGRKGQRCRVTARGKFNSIRVEFEDGYIMITSGNAIRKVPSPLASTETMLGE